MSRPRACRFLLFGGVALVAGAIGAVAETPPKITITDLGGQSGYQTTARGINDAGDIVGERFRTNNPDSFESHGLIWRKDATGHYGPTEIGGLPNLTNSYPRSINNLGRIAGYVEPVDLLTGAPPQVAMWEMDQVGVYVPFGLGEPSFAYSETANFDDGGHVLNELGQIAGTAAPLPDWVRHAFLWAEPGLLAPTDLSPSLDRTDFTAYGVNNAGFVVGNAMGTSPDPPGHFQKAILWRPDGAGSHSQAELPMPVGVTATAYDINDKGQVIGMVSGSSSRSAVIWEKRADSGDYELHYLGLPPGATSSAARAINNSGDVVGWAQIGVFPNAFRHALLWQEDQSRMLVPTDLGTLPSGTTSEAFGVNQLGQIVGRSTYWDVTAGRLVGHAVLWEVKADVTPPEIANAAAHPAVLWPPNHEMIQVTVAYDVTDDSGSVTCSLGPVSCNEPFTSEDWLVVDNSHLQLRSERHGSGSGRIYTIPITCTDVSGNAASQPVVVTVPHDQSE